MIERNVGCVLLLSAAVFGQVPVPSAWEGRVTGTLRGVRFDLPVSLELKPALPFEKNPFHLFVGTTEVKRVGDFGLMSAAEMGTGGSVKTYSQSRWGGIGIYDKTVARVPGRGNVTLQYLSMRQEGSVVTAALSETQADAAAAGNIFVGPNVSAAEASDVMRGVMEQMGPTEMFVFARGATLRLEFSPGGVTGSVAGQGGSVLGTSSPVAYRATLRARRVR